MKDKYNDNKLAEELDLIVLTDDTHAKRGLKAGALGTLIRSYTKESEPLYAEFALSDGTKREEPLSLWEFRVLNEKSERDISVIISHLLANRTQLGS